MGPSSSTAVTDGPTDTDRTTRTRRRAGERPARRERTPDPGAITGRDLTDLPHGAYLFVAPHLHDAIAGAGALVERLAGAMPVVVATVFTSAGQAGPGRPGWVARRYLRRRSTGARRPAGRAAADLFATLRGEDREVVGSAGARAVHLGHVDALFRRRPWGTSGWGRAVGAALPDLASTYPTYRFAISRGEVSPADADAVRRVEADVRELVDRIEPPAVFVPAGASGNVDHVIVRDAVLAVCPWATLWAEPAAPGHPAHPVPEDVLTRSRWVFDGDPARKAELVAGYRSRAATHGRQGEGAGDPGEDRGPSPSHEVFYGPQPLLDHRLLG